MICHGPHVVNQWLNRRISLRVLVAIFNISGGRVCVFNIRHGRHVVSQWPKQKYFPPVLVATYTVLYIIFP